MKMVLQTVAGASRWAPVVPLCLSACSNSARCICAHAAVSIFRFGLLMGLWVIS
jgi:hypothetical protein